jgi:hypothetical protein
LATLSGGYGCAIEHPCGSHRIRCRLISGDYSWTIDRVC